MILPNMDALQKHITHAKTLMYDKKFPIVDDMMELLAEVQIVFHANKVLKEIWNKTMEIQYSIMQIHVQIRNKYLYKNNFEES